MTPKDPLRINARDLKISNVEKIGSFWAEWSVQDLIMNRCIKLRVKFDFQLNTADFYQVAPGNNFFVFLEKLDKNLLMKPLK